MRVILHRFQLGLLAFYLQHFSKQRIWAFLKHKLVGEQIGYQRTFKAVIGVAVGLPRFHAFAVRVPEIGRQFAHPGVKQVGVFEHLVIEIVFGGQPQRARLDAHIDVFRHQNNLAFGVVLGQKQHHAQNLVIHFAGRHTQRDVAGDGLSLQIQAPGRGIVAEGLERDAFFDVIELGHHFIQKTTGLARVARHFGHAFFVQIKFFQCRNRHIHIVLFKTKQTGGVVHQHIGVKNKQLGRSGRFTGHGRI